MERTTSVVGKPLDLRISAEQIESVKNAIITTMQGRELNIDNIPVLTASIMIVTGKMEELSGGMKKEVLIEGIKRYINDSALDQDKKTELSNFIDKTTSFTVDALAAYKDGSLPTVEPKKSCCLIM